MTRIEVDLASGLVVIKAEGHANYAEHGKDIVCASVSTVLQTAVLGLQMIAEQYPEHVQIQIREGSNTDENQSLEA